MVQITFEDLESLHPGAGLLSKAHLAAENCNLDHLFDAYQAFCLTSSTRLTWRTLANFMELAIQSSHLISAPGDSRLILQPQDPYRIYLSELTSEELGNHTSDVVVAFFIYAGVLQSQHHLERKKESSGLEVTDWTTKGPDDVQAIVRTHFLQLSRGFLRILFEGVKDEIVARLQEWDDSVAPSGSWTPCSGSHLDILLRLDIQIDPALTRVIQQKATRLREPWARRWNFQPSAQSFSQRTSLFRRLRNPQGTPSALDSIQELQDVNKTSADSDGQSIMSFAGYDDSKQWNRSSKRSSFSDFRSFVTAYTHGTGSSLRRSIVTAQSRRSAITNATTNRSSIQTFLSWPSNALEGGAEEENEWSLKLRLRNIVSDPELADWSGGRGQHAQFSSEEQDLIPLVSERPIAETSTAVVDSVICRRVRLVRKVIKLGKNRKMRDNMQEEVMREVQQLYNAQHAHIVRLVGTYVIQNQLAILIYPRAEWNLEHFLSNPPASFGDEELKDALRRFFGCLAKVLDFVHSFPIKHKDIKPHNILVRDMRASTIDNNHSLQVYLTDFGSSKVYQTIDDTRTEGLTTFTRLYAAEEVLGGETRDLSTDIFSLGCVFAEMLATTVDYTGKQAPRSALFYLRDNGDGTRIPYCYLIDEISTWLKGLSIDESDTTSLAVRSWIPLMLSEESRLRPSAHNIAEDLRLMQTCSSCERATPEAFERIAQG